MAIIKDEEQNTRVVRSRIQLLMKFPFYGTLILYMPVEETYDIDTFATDGKKLYYNPEFCKKLDDGELNWVMVHETMHAALGHMYRRGYRDHQKFNIAADYCVHSILKEQECSDLRMPKNCLYDAKFNNKATEEIYDLLPDQPKMQGKGKGKGQNGSGKDKNNNGSGSDSGNDGQQTLDDHSMWDEAQNSSDAQKQAREWTERMVSAAEVAESKQKGSIPGYLKRLIGSIVKPQKNWRELLAEFIEHEVFDYGFCPPDRRLYSISEALLPGFSEETDVIKSMYFVIDTSGSISDKELTVFYSEIVGCIQQFGSLKGHLLFCDTRVAADYEIEDIDDVLKAKPKGGGGTRMEAAIEYIMEKAEQGEDVAGAAILTDCWDDYELKEVPFKTLWCSTTDRQGPKYGLTVPFKA